MEAGTAELRAALRADPSHVEALEAYAHLAMRRLKRPNVAECLFRRSGVGVWGLGLRG